MVCAALVAMTMGAGAEDKALFIELPAGVLPADVNSTGTVVGTLTRGGGFYWTPNNGVVYVGGVSADSVSLRAERIAGEALDARGVQHAAIWQRAAEWRLLGSISPSAVPCDALLSSSYDTSDDGAVIVGLAYNGCNIARAFRWEESTGMVDLGSTVEGRPSRANGVSGDGRVIVGWQDTTVRRGARWVDGRQTLFVGPTVIVGEAQAANRDGSLIVGQACEFATNDDLTANQQAWTWTQRDGVQCLQPPRRIREKNFIGVARATSEDGRVIGGSHSFGLEAEAVLWINREPHYLKDYLRANGAPQAFEGWVNTGFITGMSRDGRVLVGQGAGPRDFTGYVVIMPSSAVTR